MNNKPVEEDGKKEGRRRGEKTRGGEINEPKNNEKQGIKYQRVCKTVCGAKCVGEEQEEGQKKPRRARKDRRGEGKGGEGKRKGWGGPGWDGEGQRW